jgi:hypothetical protein
MFWRANTTATSEMASAPKRKICMAAYSRPL